MGLPALKQAPRAARSQTPRLKVVRPKAKPAKRSKATQAAACRTMFQTFALVIACIALLGLGRVWLSVQAAEASLSSSDLQAQIKSARYEGDMLEVRRSTLGSPSRIRTIAGKALGMTPSRKVTYLDLATGTSAAAPVRTVPVKPAVVKVAKASTTSSAFDSIIEKVMTLSAGEAQVLLVGDVGLASAK